MKTASVTNPESRYISLNPINKMKRLIILLLMLVLTQAYHLRSSPNGPTGLDIFDDDKELDEEDGPTDDFPPIGDDLPIQEATVDSDDDDDDDDMGPQLEDFGELMNDPSFAATIMETIQGMFQTADEKIVSEPGQTADCYALDYVKCSFAAEEEPVVWVIEYDDTPAEYQLTVERNTPETAVMRRRLKASHCEAFADVFLLWNREVSCNIEEYAHKISIKHIG